MNKNENMERCRLTAFEDVKKNAKLFKSSNRRWLLYVLDKILDT